VIAGAVPEVDGQWVTSKDVKTIYYAPKSSSRWRGWAPGNRVWFRNLDDLLRAFPCRVKAPD
jgi:hypothetical protein